MKRKVASTAYFMVLLVSVFVWSLPASGETPKIQKKDIPPTPSQNIPGKIPVPIKPLKPQKKMAIIIWHNDFKRWNSVDPTIAKLQNRGYSVTATDDAATGLQAIKQAASSLSSGDYLVVYLAGHGSNARNYGDVSKSPALEHAVESNTGWLSLKDSAPIFETISQKGINLTVMDGSCNGAETVYNAMGAKYCAMATAGVYSPGLTGFPNPGNAISMEGTPGFFGLWWSNPHMTASWMNGEIISAIPHRANQRLFRNDKGDFANLSIFLRTSIDFMKGLDLGGWNLRYMYCYLYQYIYADDYSALTPEEKGKFTNNLQTYLLSIRAQVDSGDPFLGRLAAYLNDKALMGEAAKVYSSQYVQTWTTLARDPTWNVYTEPLKHKDEMRGLTPDSYTGVAGFNKIANDLKDLVAAMQATFSHQEALLHQIDNTVRSLRLPEIPDMSPRFIIKIWPPRPGEQLIQFNQLDRANVEKFTALEKQFKIDRQLLLKRTPEVRFAAKPEYLKALIPNLSHIPDSLKREQLENLIAEFKDEGRNILYIEGRISFLLSIVEDAVSKVQGGGSHPCDVVRF